MRSPKAIDWQGRPPDAPLLKRNFPGFVKVTAWRAFQIFYDGRPMTGSSIIFVVEAISVGFSLQLGAFVMRDKH
jgi:hypothetical protein